jgi:hypothetical protein
MTGINGLRGLLVAVWFIAGFYFGVAGLTTASRLESTVRESADSAGSSYFEYDGLTFRDRESLNAFLRDRQFSQFVSWTFELPVEVLSLMTSLAWGILGGATRLIKNLIDRVAIQDLPVFLGPLFGGLLGLMVWLMAELAPVLFFTGDTTARPLTLVALSFFGGLFSEDTFEWVRKRARKIFKA